VKHVLFCLLIFEQFCNLPYYEYIIEYIIEKRGAWASFCTIFEGARTFLYVKKKGGVLLFGWKRPQGQGQDELIDVKKYREIHTVQWLLTAPIRHKKKSLKKVTKTTKSSLRSAKLCFATLTATFWTFSQTKCTITGITPCKSCTFTGQNYTISHSEAVLATFFSPWWPHFAHEL